MLRVFLYVSAALLAILSIPAPPVLLTAVVLWWLLACHESQHRARRQRIAHARLRERRRKWSAS